MKRNTLKRIQPISLLPKIKGLKINYKRKSQIEILKQRPNTKIDSVEFNNENKKI